MAHLTNLALIGWTLQVDGLNRKFNELGTQGEISYKLEEDLLMDSTLIFSNVVIWHGQFNGNSSNLGLIWLNWQV